MVELINNKIPIYPKEKDVAINEKWSKLSLKFQEKQWLL